MDGRDGMVRSQCTDLRCFCPEPSRALDREIPWREIVQRGSEVIVLYSEAAEVEWKNWCSFDFSKPIPKEEIDLILADLKLCRRVFKARAACRDKVCGHGHIKAECRVVLVGCNGPDLHLLFRNSPVGTRTSFYIVLVVCAFGSNDESGRWKMFNAESRSPGKTASS